MFQSAELEFLFESVHTYGEGRIHFQEFKKILRNDLKVMAFLHNKKSVMISIKIQLQIQIKLKVRMRQVQTKPRFFNSQGIL